LLGKMRKKLLKQSGANLCQYQRAPDEERYSENGSITGSEGSTISGAVNRGNLFIKKLHENTVASKLDSQTNYKVLEGGGS